jgi:hypothetical protein
MDVRVHGAGELPASAGPPVIIEALIGGVTVCFCASLVFARSIIVRPRSGKSATEMRRILERQRGWWLESIAKLKTSNEKRHVTDIILKIDEELKKVADETSDDF